MSSSTALANITELCCGVGQCGREGLLEELELPVRLSSCSAYVHFWLSNVLLACQQLLSICDTQSLRGMLIILEYGVQELGQ